MATFSNDSTWLNEFELVDLDLSSMPFVLPEYDAVTLSPYPPPFVKKSDIFPASPLTAALISRPQASTRVRTPKASKSTVVTPKSCESKFECLSPLPSPNIKTASASQHIVPVLATVTSFPVNHRFVFRAIEATVPVAIVAEEITASDEDVAKRQDQIVRSLSADQLKAVAGAFEKVRWTNDVQKGCTKWIESNPSATEDQIRAVRALVNPKYWEHSKRIVDNISSMVHKLIGNPMFGEDSKKKRSRSPSLLRFTSLDKQKRICNATELVTSPRLI